MLQVAPNRRNKASTLAEVARQAGVSLATASRVLNGGGRTVGEPLRTRVVESAELLGYRANAQAQAIARGANDFVGLLVHDIADPYFAAIAAGVMHEAEERGLVVMLATTRRDPERELSVVSMLRSQRARAIVLVGSRTTDRVHTERLAKEVQGFVSSGGAVATVSQNLLGTDCVLVQNRAAAKELATRLCALGHRRFAVLGGPKDLLTARDRLAGFRQGLRAAGVDEPQVVHGAFTRDGGYQQAAVLARDLQATCVFAVNDVMAVGAMAAFRDSGISVPEDVSMAGFDDIDTLRDLTPSLTTVELPLYDMGVQATRLAVAPQPGGAPRVTPVRGQVVLRDSTCDLRS